MKPSGCASGSSSRPSMTSLRLRTWSKSGIGDGHLRGQLGVRGDKLAVRGERAATGLAVQVGEAERRHRLPFDALRAGGGEGALDQRLDVVEALVRGSRQDDGRVAAEGPVRLRDQR